jgi:hypothetical protein
LGLKIDTRTNRFGSGNFLLRKPSLMRAVKALPGVSTIKGTFPIQISLQLVTGRVHQKQPWGRSEGGRILAQEESEDVGI